MAARTADEQGLAHRSVRHLAAAAWSTGRWRAPWPRCRLASPGGTAFPTPRRRDGEALAESVASTGRQPAAAFPRSAELTLSAGWWHARQTLAVQGRSRPTHQQEPVMAGWHHIRHGGDGSSLGAEGLTRGLVEAQAPAVVRAGRAASRLGAGSAPPCRSTASVDEKPPVTASRRKAGGPAAGPRWRLITSVSSTSMFSRRGL